MNENDVFRIAVGERPHRPLAQHIAVVTDRAEQRDDSRTVISPGLDQHGRVMPLEQRTHLGHHDKLVALDIALDQIDPVERREQLAAAPHLSLEFDERQPSRRLIEHEVLPRAEIAVAVHRRVAHANRPVRVAERAGENLDMAETAQIVPQHAADRLDRLDGPDTSLRPDQRGQRIGVIAKVGPDVDRRIALRHEIFQETGILVGGRAADPRAVAEQVHSAQRLQITVQRQSPVHGPADRMSHSAHFARSFKIQQFTSPPSTSVTNGL